MSTCRAPAPAALRHSAIDHLVNVATRLLDTRYRRSSSAPMIERRRTTVVGDGGGSFGGRRMYRHSSRYQVGRTRSVLIHNYAWQRARRSVARARERTTTTTTTPDAAVRSQQASQRLPGDVPEERGVARRLSYGSPVPSR